MSSFSLLQSVGPDAEGANFLIRFEGRGTMQESPAFQNLVVEMLKEHPEAKLTLDLEECVYLDSTFLGCLMSLSRRFGRTPERRFEIGLTPATRARLLAPSHLDRVLPLVERLPTDSREWTAVPTESTTATILGRHVLECHQEIATVEGSQQFRFRAIADQLAQEMQQR